jgi:hypothetical protein
MYNESIDLPEVSKKNSLLVELIDRFDKNNAWQYEAINKIQEKLHLVLNRRVPEKPSENKPEITSHDFYQDFEKKLRTMQSNCERLETILKHFNEII